MNQDQNNNQNEGSLTVYKSNSPLKRYTKPPPEEGMWKKSEVTIQEKIVTFTKIGPAGVPQILIEREKQQVEVVHMETVCGTTFAHRETTQYEASEELNETMVHFENGREEFVHFKSKTDEFSLYENTMPGADEGNTSSSPAPSPIKANEGPYEDDDSYASSF